MHAGAYIASYLANGRTSSRSAETHGSFDAAQKSASLSPPKEPSV